MLTGNFSNNMTFGVDFVILHFKVQKHTFFVLLCYFFFFYPSLKCKFGV